MTRSATHSEREAFIEAMVRHAPASSAALCARLMRYSATYYRLVSGDGELSFKEHRKLERVHLKIRRLCEEIGCKVVFFGGTVLVSLPNATIKVPRIGGI